MLSDVTRCSRKHQDGLMVNSCGYMRLQDALDGARSFDEAPGGSMSSRRFHEVLGGAMMLQVD